MIIRIGLASLMLNNYGQISDIQLHDGYSIWPPGLDPQAFIRIGINGEVYNPISCTVSLTGDFFDFSFARDLTLTIQTDINESYSTFGITRLSSEIDHVLVGPIFSALNKSIGEIIGVVHGEKYAFGIQSLNPKTVAGHPTVYNDFIHSSVTKKTLPGTSVASIEFSECAAYPAQFGDQNGSLLQLFIEARDRLRRKDFLNYSDIEIPPLLDDPDAKIQGGAFALFVSVVTDSLHVIGQIEMKEGLPHPLIQGEWNKLSRLATQSYMIADFTPDQFEYLLDRTVDAGMSHLYHAEPFKNWGHFDLSPTRFPDGIDTLKHYAEKAGERGLGLGIHTLSSFASNDDPYITPAPDKRLMSLDQSQLKATITEDQDRIPLINSDGFLKVTNLQTLRIDDELIRYGGVEDEYLTDCIRGAWGTEASEHSINSKVVLLTDHPYRVFFPDFHLQKNFSETLGILCQEAGASMISFDGLEGCTATGEDILAMNRFGIDCWAKSGRNDLLSDASRLTHFLWHMHSRMNWGEPWGAQMREGMIEQRILNQEFFNRNLLPRMLGWFLLRKADRKFEATPPEDIEWALSMAAGFDAGFALSTSYAALNDNHCSGEILKLIKSWEHLRLANAFPNEIKDYLKQRETEWHLEQKDNVYHLYPMAILTPPVCDLLEQQPGQPGGADWMIINPFSELNYDLRLRVNGYGDIHNPSFSNKNGTLKFNCTVKAGQYLWFKNNDAYITDRNYQLIDHVNFQGQSVLSEGNQNISFACEFSGEEGPEIIVKLFVMGKPHVIEFG